MPRLGAGKPAPDVRGTRVVIDLRPLQEPERTPITAHYLERLLGAFAERPLEGESFVVINRTLRDDPSRALEERGLPVAARRRLPPTSRLFRSAGLTVDPFLLRGAELGPLQGRGEPTRHAVYHTAGGAVPLASRLPVVATLLDLAPWELPRSYAASPAARFGHRLRARVLHDAARVIVCSRATADAARRLLRLPIERFAVVPLAVDESFRRAGADRDGIEAVRTRVGLPGRYIAFCGRYDARKDLGTLFRALRRVREQDAMEPPRAVRRTAAPSTRPARAARPADATASRASGTTGASSPPVVALALQYAAETDRQTLQRAVERSGVADLLRVAPALTAEERAALVAGAEAFVYPSLSEGTGLSVLEALSLGVPVICSRAGAPAEFVASAGIVVEPRDPARLAAAIGALWTGGSVAAQIRHAAAARGAAWSWTWADVATETRKVYAAASEAP